MNHMMDAVAHRRLMWKCKRGLLELDLVFEKYFEGHFDVKDANDLNALLDLPDNDLWDILSGRSDRFEDRFGGIVARLRAV